MPIVSVIIPTYQHAHFVGQAIESVLAQTYEDYEIIVVDDGSTDNTSEVLAEFGNQIKAIHHQENRGLSAARNTGIMASHGSLVAFLDADDVWMPDKLEKQVPLFERNESVGLVYSDLSYFDKNGILPGTAFEGASPQSGMVHSAIFVRDFIPMPTVVVRRSCFDVVGLFDETLMACEDHDMWLRISETWAVDFVNEPLARYRFAPTQMHKDRERMLVNRLRVQEKAFTTSPALRELDISTLDRCFYDLYLELARFYINHHQGAKARPLLRRYMQMRGPIRGCFQTWFASWIPRRLLGSAIKVRARAQACG